MEKYQQMPFPEREWNDIRKQLKEVGTCSTVRCCNQLGKFKIGDVFSTPWDSKIKIVKVTRYSKAENIPTWDFMDKGMKISVRKGGQYGNSQWDYIIFKKIN
jgi:hypothetical protein